MDFGSQHNPAAASFELVLEDSPPIDEGPKSDKENDHVEDEIPTDENAQISAGLSGSEDIEEVSRKENSDELDADEHVKHTTGTASEGGAARVEDEAEVNELLVSSDEELPAKQTRFQDLPPEDKKDQVCILNVSPLTSPELVPSSRDMFSSSEV